MIPVVWHQEWIDDTKPGEHRYAFWDQTLIADLLHGKLWRPVDALEYRHVETFGELDGASGAVVVVPARHHGGGALLDSLKGQLDRLDWAVVILTGDEETAFPWRAIRRINRRVWVQTPTPVHHTDAAYKLPNGYGPGTPELVASPFMPQRNWCFAGQITHKLREEMAVALRQRDDGMLVETAGFTQGLDRPEYIEALMTSKVALCPSGPVHPDTFRLYEALEAGCLPIVDRGYVPWDFWQFTYGDVPFPVVNDWSDTDAVIDAALRDWPSNATRASAWWQAQKREMAYTLDRHVREVSE